MVPRLDVAARSNEGSALIPTLKNMEVADLVTATRGKGFILALVQRD